MVGLRGRLTIMLGGAVLAAAALAAPVGAQNGTGDIWIAHGIPGVKVDVCVNGDTVRAGFLYGGRFRAEVPAETPLTVKVRAHAAEACTGTVLIRDRVSVSTNGNVTALATLRDGAPTLVTWNNRPQAATCGGGDVSVTVHHEAKAGRMVFWLAGGSLGVMGVTLGDPGALGIPVGRTESAGPIPVLVGPNVYAATPLFGETPLMPPVLRLFAELTDYQLILVGTNPDNYRWIRFGNPALYC